MNASSKMALNYPGIVVRYCSSRLLTVPQV